MQAFGKRWRTVRVCRACWDRLYGGNPARVLDDDVALYPKPRCSQCGTVTREGIYVRRKA